ncbi:MAG: hypothetical protein H6767_06720 [Candidatus Peribacteria bacterium]|nr:MAG: hypothetical protein H6767_06720 [Candidatus Peribacteria bacterium]
MPANKRPRRLNYAVNKKGPVAGTKVQNAIGHYKKLQKREAFEGKTKWIENAFKVVEAKLKKY